VRMSFDELVAEADAAPITGWDFTWLDGRATEERPSWRYRELVARRITQVARTIDLQCGGGEMLAGLPALPEMVVATEGHPPNLALAARRLSPRGIQVVAADEDRSGLPFTACTFDLVTSRHPVSTRWDEIARVLRPGGTYLSQQVGPYSLRELTEFMMGPRPGGSTRDPERARAAAIDAGLRVDDLRQARLRTVFFDVGAVVYFLRLVVWIVPGFSVEAYRDRLEALHRQIQAEGPYVAHASRFLIEATKPA
jgi:SAM-dependent methyltransferase